MAWRRALGGVLAAGLMAVACDATDEAILAALGSGCVLDSDCQGELVCVFRRCHQACDNSSDCPSGQRCVLGQPPSHVCLLEDETECVRTSDCPETLVCGVDLRCRDECKTDPDCLADQACAQQTCALDDELDDGRLPPRAQEAETTCLFDSECPVTQLCRDGVCRFECVLDTDCASRQCGDDHRCLPAKPTGPSCVPGFQQQCSCSTGGTGVEICAPDGLGFGDCLGCQPSTAGPCDPVMGETDGSFRWARPFTFATVGFGFRDVAVAPNGEVVLAAVVNTLGPVDFGGQVYTATDGSDAVLVRFLADGTLDSLYGIDSGGINGQLEAGAVGMSNTGQLWVAGSYGNAAGPPNFGVGSLPPGPTGIFLARFDANGTPDVASGYAISSPLGSGIFDLAVGPNGHVAIQGTFYGTINFDGNVISTPGPNDPGTFIALFDANGTNLFARAFDSSFMGTNFSARLAVNAAGQVFATGILQGTVDLGSGPRTAVGTTDAVLAAYEANGTPIFDAVYDSAGPMDNLQFGDPTVDGAGNFLVGGSYEAPAPPDLGAGVLPGGMGTNMFELAFDVSGVPVPMSQIATPHAGAGALFVTGTGERIIAGGMQDAVTLGPCTYGATSTRPFFARRTAAGTIDWVRTFDMNGPRYAVSPTGEIYALFFNSGGAVDTIDFGGGPITGNHYLLKLVPTLP